MNKEISIIIGQRINRMLGIRNMSQKELAQQIGEKYENTISDYVNGRRCPNTEKIINMSRVFDVSSDYLLGLSDDMTTDIETKAICKKTHLSEETVNVLCGEPMETFYREDIKRYNKIFDVFIRRLAMNERSECLINTSTDNFVGALCQKAYFNLYMYDKIKNKTITDELREKYQNQVRVTFDMVSHKVIETPFSDEDIIEDVNIELKQDFLQGEEIADYRLSRYIVEVINDIIAEIYNEQEQKK